MKKILIMLLAIHFYTQGAFSKKAFALYIQKTYLTKAKTRGAHAHISNIKQDTQGMIVGVDTNHRICFYDAQIDDFLNFDATDMNQYLIELKKLKEKFKKVQN